MHRITTVTEAAASLDLTTIERVKLMLALKSSDTSADDFLEMVIPISSGRVDNYCTRVFAKQTYQDLFRWRGLLGYWGNDFAFHSGVGEPFSGTRRPIVLRNVPVRSIVSFTEDGNALTEGVDFELEAETGILYRLYTPTASRIFPVSSAVIVYQAGFDPPPAAAAGSLIIEAPQVERAVIGLTIAEYKGRGRDPMMKATEDPRIGRKEFWVGGPPSSGGLPQDIADMLDQYIIAAFG